MAPDDVEGLRRTTDETPVLEALKSVQQATEKGTSHGERDRSVLPQQATEKGTRPFSLFPSRSMKVPGGSELKSAL